VSEGVIGGMSNRHRHYILFMVTLVYVVNYLDRQILAILLPLIKAEFGVSDSALGLLAGPAFAVIYATLGIPLAFVADRVNRRNIIAGSMALFSLMTVVCNFATSFMHLLLARFGTGIGEAGTGPSINSIIADLYPPKQRATALSIYSAGLNIGLLLAFFGGGWIAQNYGWRAAFLVSGLPGLVLVVLFLLTVRPVC
jgi:MFS family permease